jgi:hypothetical protein
MDPKVVKSMCIHSKCHNKTAYACGESVLPNATSFRDLGVMRSGDGGYGLQASYAASKARRLCGALRDNLVFPNAQIGWKIFQSYIYPILSYGSVAWNPERKSDVITLERVQRQFTKSLMLQKSLSYEQRLENLKALTAETVRYASDMIFAFKLIHGLIPFNPMDFGVKLSSNKSRGPRFVHEKLTRSGARYFFRYRIPIEWDKLPERIRSHTNLFKFKNSLLSWLKTH